MGRQQLSAGSRGPGRSGSLIAVTVCALASLTSCSATGENASPLLRPSDPTSSDASPTLDPRPDPTESEPTRAELWRQNFETDRRSYRTAVERTVVAGAPITVITATALDTCNALVAGRALPRRLALVSSGFGEITSLSSGESLAFIDATLASVCPEQRAVHEAQVAATEREPQPEEVFYANCTDAEDAGAAPILRGEPGYSTDLDADGDGIACDQP